MTMPHWETVLFSLIPVATHNLWVPHIQRALVWSVGFVGGVFRDIFTSRAERVIDGKLDGLVRHRGAGTDGEGDGRPSFDDIYMRMALMMARRSTCRRAQVGCVIATQDNQKVLAVGYNGGPKGLWNDCLSDEPGKCGHLHAEINALIKANYSDAAPKKAYVSSSPCLACATALINGGIGEVIYHTPYRDDTGLRTLRQAGVRVRQHIPAGDAPRDIPVEPDGKA